MSDYVPTTGIVRQVWTQFSEYGGLVVRTVPTLADDRDDEFDRWLMAAKERAWEEGREAGFEDRLDEQWSASGPRNTNPYRSEP